jgi:hypothetical protein
MKLYLKLLAICIVFSACKNDTKSTESNANGVHKVVAQEALYVKEYIYVRVLENGEEKWLAAPITQVKVGNTYYHGKAMKMENFESKDLNKTFDEVFFIEKLSIDENGTAIHTTLTPAEKIQPANTTPPPPPPSEGAITLAQLFANKKAYAGKQVTITGEVTKFNPAILGVNWFHIEDGTDYNGENDLTVTTEAQVVIGTNVTFTGTVVLDKDFGAGYFYNIIVEKATVK